MLIVGQPFRLGVLSRAGQVGGREVGALWKDEQRVSIAVAHTVVRSRAEPCQITLAIVAREEDEEEGLASPTEEWRTAQAVLERDLEGASAE